MKPSSGIADRLRRQKRKIENIKPSSTMSAKSKRIEKPVKVQKSMQSMAAKAPVSGTNARRPKKGEKNYYENFSFLYTRTAFRTMTMYFKLAYKPFFDNSKGLKKQSAGQTVHESLVTFAKLEFPGLLESLSSDEARCEFIELLKLLVLSHRHNRNDAYLQNPMISFDTVREPMYKYSK